MIYKFDRNTLQFVKDKRKMRLLSGSILLIIIGSFILGRYVQSTILDNIEVKYLEYKRQDSILTQDNLINLLKCYDIKYPYIVAAQAYAETNLGRSGVGKSNKNLYGMRYAHTRSTLALGEENGFAVFESWKESTLDYKLWQESVFGNNVNVTEQQYYTILDKIYCEGNNTYSVKVKQIVNDYKLKSKF